MPFLAACDDGTLTPQQASHKMKLWCRECSQALSLVREHEREGSFVASHFRHVVNRGCGGESPIHAKMKSIAADKLKHEYDGEIAELALDSKTVNGKLPDVLALFESPIPPYGRGIAIECQYRHIGKDRKAAEHAYLDAEITTLWLEEPAFDLDGYDVDFTEGEWFTTWPNAISHPHDPGYLGHETHQQSTPLPATFHLDHWVRVKQRDTLPPATQWGLPAITADYAFGSTTETGPKYLPRTPDIESSVRASFPAQWWREVLRGVYNRAQKVRVDNEYLGTFDYRKPYDIRCPAHPLSVARDTIESGDICRSDEHDWIELDGYYWRECRQCGLADVTVADIGQSVKTPNTDRA